MGIPSEIREFMTNNKRYPLIRSPIENEKHLRTKKCTQEGVRAGAKAAVVACVASAVPTLVAVRKIPWAKANLNYTAQALIISAALGGAWRPLSPSTFKSSDQNAVFSSKLVSYFHERCGVHRRVSVSVVSKDGLDAEKQCQMISRQLIGQNVSSHRQEQSLIEKLLLRLKQCKSTKSLQQIHTQMIANSLLRMPIPNFMLSKMIDLKDFNYSTRFFDEVPANTYAFSIMIRGLAKNWQRFDLAVDCFAKMNYLGVKPDNFTYPFVFISCGNLLDSGTGRLVHCQVVKNGLLLDFHVVHSLITMYSRCGQLGFARIVFDEMTMRDSVSWNSIISGYSRSGFAGEAAEMFWKMREEGFEPNEMTLVSVLAACGDLGNLKLGRWIEGYVMEKAMELNSYVGSALINMYGKSGELDSATRIFNCMRRKDLITWNAMISGYAQNGQSDETFSLFDAMLKNGPEPNQITLIAALSACASIGALNLGKWIDDYANRKGLEQNIYVATALVDMYAKCGDLQCAARVFENMPWRNEVSWNTMISAHASHGRAEDALDLFQSMLVEKTTFPNDITFVAVLSACVHAGFVEEGRRLFDAMSLSFGLTPTVEHYSCMVDLLSRAGRVHEAWDFIQKMPQKPDEILLGSLLGACQKLRNVDIGEKASKLLLEIEPLNSGNYIISSKIYAGMRRWEDCARMRMLMKQKGVTKTPGCSWIEMDGLLREFHAGDLSVDDAQEIHRILSLVYEDMIMDARMDVDLLTLV